MLYVFSYIWLYKNTILPTRVLSKYTYWLCLPSVPSGYCLEHMARQTIFQQLIWWFDCNAAISSFIYKYWRLWSVVCDFIVMRNALSESLIYCGQTVANRTACRLTALGQAVSAVKQAAGFTEHWRTPLTYGRRGCLARDGGIRWVGCSPQRRTFRCEWAARREIRWRHVTSSTAPGLTSGRLWRRGRRQGGALIRSPQTSSSTVWWPRPRPAPPLPHPHHSPSTDSETSPCSCPERTRRAVG